MINKKEKERNKKRKNLKAENTLNGKKKKKYVKRKKPRIN